MSNLNKHYINPLTDFGFRILFYNEKHKDWLRHFIEATFEGEKKIIDIQFVSAGGDQLKSEWQCTEEMGNQFTIVIQLLDEQSFRSKTKEFMGKFFHQEDNDTAESSHAGTREYYLLGLLDLAAGDSDDPYFREINFIKNDKENENTNLLCFKLLDLTEFDKDEGELSSELDKWFYVLKNVSQFEALPASLEAPAILNFLESATISNLNETQKQDYDMSVRARGIRLKESIDERSKENVYSQNDNSPRLAGFGKHRFFSVFRLGYEIGYEDAQMELTRERILRKQRRTKS